MCCWEFAMLVVQERIRIEQDVHQWVEQALAPERVRALPLPYDVAIDAALLEREGFVADPADRVIYATARSLNAGLVTKDKRIRRFDRAATVW
jgi:PIN domain nuclease of toxin-antitoxin system